MDLRFRTVISLCALIFAAGCNGDVFIDEFLPEDMKVEVSGDSPKAVIRFDSANWDIISVRNSAGGAMSGEIVLPDGSSCDGFLYGKGLVDLKYSDGFLDFGIGRHEERSLEIEMNENMYGFPYTITLVVGNDYQTRRIAATLQPSPDYQIDSIRYDWSGLEYHDNMGETVDTVTVSNCGDSGMKVTVYPFGRASRKVHFRVNDDPYQEIFKLFRNGAPEVRIPDITDSLHCTGTFLSYFVYGEQLFPVSDGLKDVSKEILVGPHESCHMETVVFYREYSVPYTIYLSNPGSGRLRTATGILDSKDPYDFFIIKASGEE